MWLYNEKKITDISQTPKGAIGFLYCIENLTTGKMYIGKKNLRTWKKVGAKRYQELKLEGVEVKRSKNKSQSKKGTPVWVHKAHLESDWLFYTGSNKELNADIEKGHTIEKQIWEFAYCSKQLTFLETEAHFKMDVIRDWKKYYNGNILGKFFPSDLNCNYGHQRHSEE